MFYPQTLTGKLFRWYLLLPPHPAKIRIQNILGRFFEMGIALRSNDGLMFKLPANDWITRHILGTGSYEPLSLSLAKKLLDSGGVFIDIGSNFGLYSCTVSYKKNVRVIAVDPNYKIIKSLVTHIKANGLQNKIQIINAAVSSKFQLVTLEEPNPSNLGTTVANTSKVGSFAVLSCSLAYILEANNLEEIDLMKIDIEGNEFDIVKNFPFEKFSVHNIILEYRENSKVSLAEFEAFFVSKGYQVLNVRGEKVNAESDILEDNIWISRMEQFEGASS